MYMPERGCWSPLRCGERRMQHRLEKVQTDFNVQLCRHKGCEANQLTDSEWTKQEVRSLCSKPPLRKKAILPHALRKSLWFCKPMSKTVRACTADLEYSLTYVGELRAVQSTQHTESRDCSWRVLHNKHDQTSSKKKILIHFIEEWHEKAVIHSRTQFWPEILRICCSASHGRVHGLSSNYLLQEPSLPVLNPAPRAPWDGHRFQTRIRFWGRKIKNRRKIRTISDVYETRPSNFSTQHVNEIGIFM